jgi:hypothetical protein
MISNVEATACVGSFKSNVIVNVPVVDSGGDIINFLFGPSKVHQVGAITFEKVHASESGSTIVGRK